jgi:hypothetical protein
MPKRRRCQSHHREGFKVQCSARVNAFVCELFDAGVPIQLLKIVFLLLVQMDCAIGEDADAAEFFCGRQAVTTALITAGFVTLPFDKDQTIHLGVMGLGCK